ncbi:hypothetical protein, partial [Sphingobacterium sp. xlx-130]|uniref:hypothetical protein n=1 Tax=Sphingobacterium sp. xlx-130 TaxID=2654323 RepID=UPI0013D9141D
MKNFNGGGRGMAVGQSDKVTELQSDKDLSSRPIEQNNRLSTMSPSGLLIREAHRNDEREVGRSAGRTGEDRGSLRSAQGLPLSGLDSFKTRSIPDGSPMNPRSPSGRDRRTIGS